MCFNQRFYYSFKSPFFKISSQHFFYWNFVRVLWAQIVLAHISVKKFRWSRLATFLQYIGSRGFGRLARRKSRGPRMTPDAKWREGCAVRSASSRPHPPPHLATDAMAHRSLGRSHQSLSACSATKPSVKSRSALDFMFLMRSFKAPYVVPFVTLALVHSANLASGSTHLASPLAGAAPSEGKVRWATRGRREATTPPLQSKLRPRRGRRACTHPSPPRNMFLECAGDAGGWEYFYFKALLDACVRFVDALNRSYWLRIY